MKRNKKNKTPFVHPGERLRIPEFPQDRITGGREIKIQQHIDRVRMLERQLKEKNREASRLYQQLRDLRQHKKIRITDHAIVRFMERVFEINFEELKKQIITEQVEKLYSQLGDGTYPTGTGNICVVIENGAIVTVIN